MDVDVFGSFTLGKALYLAHGGQGVNQLLAAPSLAVQYRHHQPPRVPAEGSAYGRLA